jgi:hypothetical protein
VIYTCVEKKDKKRSTKYTHKAKNRVIRTPIKTMGEPSCSRRVSSSCSTSDTRRVNLATNPAINHGRGKDRDSCYSICSFICMFCRSLFVLLYFFFWPLCCLFFFDIRILITLLLSSNSCYPLCGQ